MQEFQYAGTFVLGMILGAAFCVGILRAVLRYARKDDDS